MLRESFFKEKSKFYLDHARKVHVIEGVMRVVRAGVARGLPMAVASGGSREHVIKVRRC